MLILCKKTKYLLFIFYIFSPIVVIFMLAIGHCRVPSVGTYWVQVVMLVVIIWNIYHYNKVLYNHVTWCPHDHILRGTTLYGKKLLPVILSEKSMVVFLQCNSECQIHFYNDKAESEPIIEVYANNNDGCLLKFFEAIKECGVNTDTKVLY